MLVIARSISAATTRRQNGAYRNGGPDSPNGMPHVEQYTAPASDCDRQLEQTLAGPGPEGRNSPRKEPGDCPGGEATPAGAAPDVAGVTKVDANAGDAGQTPVGARAAEGTPPARVEAGAGTVINSLQAGHMARAEARSSDVVSSFPQCGQLNSIATLRFRWWPLP